LSLADLGTSSGDPRDCRVWEAVFLGREGRILLSPRRLGGAGAPPGYAACLRRLRLLLRREGFPAGLADPKNDRIRAGKYRRL
jgi:hypothetical protein